MDRQPRGARVTSVGGSAIPAQCGVSYNPKYTGAPLAPSDRPHRLHRRLSGKTFSLAMIVSSPCDCPFARITFLRGRSAISFARRRQAKFSV
jgi:hypothetical protein